MVGAPQQRVHVVAPTALQEFFGMFVGDRRVRRGHVRRRHVQRLHVGVTIDQRSVASPDGDD